MFAASKCGAIYLPLNWRLAAREIEDVLKDAEPTILFVGDEFADRIKDLAGAVPGLKSIVALDRGGSTPHEPYADWLGREVAADPQVSATAEDTVVLMYTSGTRSEESRGGTECVGTGSTRRGP